MQTMAIVVLVYGFLVLVGGVLGWKKAGSAASLISGGLFGVILLGSGAGMWMGIVPARLVALGAAVLLMIVMGIRYATTKKLMPAGMIMVLSFVVAVLLGLSLKS
jgi:uncharacterized membrane protein (UPF0136 family)